MNCVTSVAHTNSGMRLSDMPGARILKIVVMSTMASSRPDKLGEGDHLRPDVRALVGRVVGAGERHVAEPARVRRGIHDAATRTATSPPNRNTQYAYAFMRGKRDAARADHQRHEVRGDRLHHRHGEEEHHRRAVHREELVVEVRADETLVRPRELRAHREREQSREQEEHEGRHDEAPRDRSCD